MNAGNKILFVCESNLIRSPLAAAIFNKLAEQLKLSSRASSAGSFAGALSRPAEHRAREAAKQSGLSLDQHRTSEFKPLELSQYRFIIAIDPDSYWQLEPHVDDKEHRLFMIGEFLRDKSNSSLPDPLEHDIQLGELMAKLQEACERVLERISK